MRRPVVVFRTAGWRFTPRAHALVHALAHAFAQSLTLSDRPARHPFGPQTMNSSGSLDKPATPGDERLKPVSRFSQLMRRPEILHGPIRLVFTCDEEIGRGTEHLRVEDINAVCGYTLDGDSQGMIDCETFSADQAIVRVTGVNTHPSVGKDVMVNAIRILSDFLTALPRTTLAPETTCDREGFIHPYSIEGGVAQAEARLILRDFETSTLGVYALMLENLAIELRSENPKAKIEIEIKQQYRNMREGLSKEPRAVPKAVEATAAAGLTPLTTIVRGGTDGSLLTAMGLPTPNLSTGEHNPHSPREWTSVEEMQSAVRVLVQLAIVWGREKV